MRRIFAVQRLHKSTAMAMRSDKSFQYAQHPENPPERGRSGVLSSPGKTGVDGLECKSISSRYASVQRITRRDTQMRLLLLLPFIGLLWVPFYNRELPSLWGFPFFYWYQFAWVPLTSLLIWIVFRNGLKKGEE
jgi:hypothetical protein